MGINRFDGMGQSYARAALAYVGALWAGSVHVPHRTTVQALEGGTCHEGPFTGTCQKPNVGISGYGPDASLSAVLEPQVERLNAPGGILNRSNGRCLLNSSLVLFLASCDD